MNKRLLLIPTWASRREIKPSYNLQRACGLKKNPKQGPKLAKKNILPEIWDRNGPITTLSTSEQVAQGMQSEDPRRPKKTLLTEEVGKEVRESSRRLKGGLRDSDTFRILVEADSQGWVSLHSCLPSGRHFPQQLDP